MLIVTGATGQLGRKVDDHLLTLVPASRIGDRTREPDRAADLAAAGIRVRRDNYDDVASLRRAWEGAERVLLMSSNARAHGGDPIARPFPWRERPASVACFTQAKCLPRPTRVSRPVAIMPRPKTCWSVPAYLGPRCVTVSKRQAPSR
ncbi:NmrA-like family protein [Loktanella atrilutea]|uniref:NmrA-like family protein n=1 Tax=Loktanella atrilutea TaxID=366533 RepID=A0A1M5FP86_LOKAT|nr:NmrA-like family protein [Loktanella atrilutea]